MVAHSDVNAPRLFISYSWTTPEHEAWVLKLAEDLTASGVHVILDKWDLREGNDSHAFMEQMVSDPTITKVAIICDRKYVEKADDRRGGVGTETQIITPQIFASNQQNQDKYVAIVREYDENGSPYLPVYFGSRIFLDFADDLEYAVSFEKLLRWIYGKPIFVRPPLGKKPSFLEDGVGLKLAIAPAKLRVVEALQSGKPHAVPALRDFFEKVAQELAGIELDLNADPFDQAVFDVVTDFLPYRNAIIDVLITVSNYRNDIECWQIVHRFFENIIPLLDRRGETSSWRAWDFDHMRIIIKEMYIYLIAVNIKYERFDAVQYYTRTPYYVAEAVRRGDEPMQMFTVFQKGLESLNLRNQRLHDGRRASPFGDLLKERAIGNSIHFNDLMAADFLLYFLSRLISVKAYVYWWPESLVYMEVYGPRPEVFVRCRSKAFFDRFKGVLGVEDKDGLLRAVEAVDANPNILPSWSYRPLRAGEVMTPDAVATMP